MTDDFDSMIKENLSKNSKCKIIPVISPEIEYFGTNGMLEYARHRINSMKASFLESLKLTDFMPINHISLNPFYTFGMITSITGNKLENDVFLWNSGDGSNTLMKLNIEALKMFSLYNGIIVALKARNLKGNELLVERIFYLPIININTEIRKKLSMVVARGPFTENVVEELLDLEADVTIMFGPFCNFETGAFNDFEQFIKNLESKLGQNKKQKIMLVPSLDDKNFVNVFPQVSNYIKNNDILLVNNPHYFYANNHLIAVSNFDALSDLRNNEYFKEVMVEEIDPLFSLSRSSRLAYLNVWQKTFSPVIPSSFNVAYGNWLDMDRAPDILITSSKLKCFVADLNPVTYLNIGASNNNYHIINAKCNKLNEYDIELDKKYKDC